MARRISKSGKMAAPENLRVELIPISHSINLDILRNKEIQNMVAQIVLLGQKRGRPSKKEEEMKNAA